jgi:hypothetical protein
MVRFSALQYAAFTAGLSAPVIVLSCSNYLDGTTAADAGVRLEASTVEQDAISAARCNPNAAFGAPVAVPSLAETDSSTYSIFLTDDELRAYFARKTTGEYQLYTSSRPNRDAPFGGAEKIVSLADEATADYEPSLVRDTLYFTRKPTDAGLGIYFATATTGGNQFGNVGRIDLPDAFTNNSASAPRPDNMSMYFAANRNGAVYDIFTVSLPYSSTAAPPRPVTEVNSPAVETSPKLTRDEKILYFSTNRADAGGGRDIWVATRNSAAEPFAAPTRDDVLSSELADYVHWISADNCVIYLSRGLPGQAYNIFAARRPQ